MTSVAAHAVTAAAAAKTTRDIRQIAFITAVTTVLTSYLAQVIFLRLKSTGFAGRLDVLTVVFLSTLLWTALSQRAVSIVHITSSRSPRWIEFITSIVALVTAFLGFLLVHYLGDFFQELSMGGLTLAELIVLALGAVFVVVATITVIKPYLTQANDAL